MSGKKLRIALVNQRYGAEVNGGSEYYTKQLAEHLKMLYDIEVLTTKALDYNSWTDHYQSDEEVIDGVLVRRFHVEKKRNVPAMKIWNRLRRYVPALRRFCENRWIDAQGPYVPGLVQYLKEHGKDYAAVLFVTYLYYPAVRGIPETADRAVFIPTAHDEPYLRFDIFRQIFTMPAGFLYLTPEEKQLVESRFPVADKPNCVTGAGVELPPQIDSGRFRAKYDVRAAYLIYAGRIEPNKGCAEMFRIFREYKNRCPESGLQLILLGKQLMDIPKADDIRALGFVSETDKFDGISGAEALWLPSQYESLSIAVLEAMALGVPVFVNGRSEVLRGHCVRSGAGVYYTGEKDAAGQLSLLLHSGRKADMSQAARQYVAEHYQWDAIVKKIDRLIAQIAVR